MKKLLSIMLVALMLTAMLASCGTPVNSDIDTDSNANTEDTTSTNTDGETNTDVSNDNINQGGENQTEHKITFDLGPHLPLVEFDYDYSSTSQDYGKIDFTKNGTPYIEYAPNCFNYFVLISCKDDTTDAFALIKEIIASAKYEIYIGIDVFEPLENKALVVFPSFTVYSEIQKNLLEGLSALESVEKIKVGYIDTNDSNEKLKGYDFYTGFQAIDYESKLITSHEEFVNLFDLTNEKNAQIKQVTEQTFENNYLLYVSNFTYCSGFINTEDVAIKDIILVENSLYFTSYEYYTGAHDQIVAYHPILIVVPKAELGEITTDELKILFYDVEMFINKDE